MMDGLPITSWQGDFESAQAILPGASHSTVAAFRQGAFARAQELGLPGKRNESWRYTSLVSLARGGLVVAAPPALDWDQAVARFPALAELRGPRLVFVQGHYAASLSSLEGLPWGLEFVSLHELLANDGPAAVQALGVASCDDLDSVQALSAAFVLGGALLRIMPGVSFAEPIHLVHLSLAGAPAFAPLAHRFRAGAGSRATVAMHHFNEGGAADVTSIWAEAWLEPNASLSISKVQVGQAESSHLACLRVHQAESSHFSSRCFDFGGQLARTEIRALANGPCTYTSLDGLYLLRGQDHADHQTRLDHLFPHGTSTQLYKGIVDGSSQGVFAGKVYVAPQAQKTNAEQRNANLLLSADAEADTKPELEIYADDVRCAHGATVGALDPAALFYLRTRGIDAEGARSLLTYGFASEMVDRVEDVGLKHAIWSHLKDWLPHTEAMTMVEEE